MKFGAVGLLVSTVFSAVGVGYFLYGKRQARVMHLICGAVLLIYPWFVSSLAVLIGVGIVFVAAPFAVAWWFGI